MFYFKDQSNVHQIIDRKSIASNKYPSSKALYNQ